MTEFMAYRGSEVSMSAKCQDLQAGIRGTLVSASLPVLRAESLESLEQLALAYVDNEPADSLYLVDPQNRVRRIIFNEKYHTARDRRSQRRSIAAFLAVFLVTALLVSSPAVGLTASVVATSLYLTTIRTGFMNEIEAGITCETLLTIVLSIISFVMGK